MVFHYFREIVARRDMKDRKIIRNQCNSKIKTNALSKVKKVKLMIRTFFNRVHVLILEKNFGKS